MMFPEKMIQVFGIMPRQRNDAVTQELLRQGLVHFIKINYLDPAIKEKMDDADESGASSDKAERTETASLTEIRKRTEHFMRMGGFSDLLPATLPDDIEPVLHREKAEKALDTFATRIESVRSHQSSIQANILKFEDIKRQLDMYGDLKNVLSQSSPYAFLQIHSGKIDPSFFEDFKSEFTSLPSLVIDISENDNDEKLVLVINMKRDESTVKNIMERYQWQDSSLSSQAEDIGSVARTGLDEKIAELKKQQEQAASEFNDIFAEKKENKPHPSLMTFLLKKKTHCSRFIRGRD
jgi:vacuolar-type H+-ATPase subunit I/STV1